MDDRKHPALWEENDGLRADGGTVGNDIEQHIQDILDGEKEPPVDDVKRCFCGLPVGDNPVAWQCGNEVIEYCSDDCKEDHRHYIRTGNLRNSRQSDSESNQ